MVLGPVMMLQLSPAQQRKADLRNKAVALGLIVRFSDLPGQRVRAGKKKATGISYAIRCVDAQNNGRADPPAWRLFWKPEEENWSWDEAFTSPASSSQTQILAAVSELPRSMHSVECRNEMLTAYWKEQGSVADVESIHSALQALKKLV